MKDRSFKHRFLLLIAAILLTLTACERPVPREDTTPEAESAPTTEVIVIPTAPPETNEAYPPTGTDQTGEPAPTEGTDGTGDTAVTPAATTEETTGTTDTTTEPATTGPADEVTHVVQAGETLGSIAQFYHVTIEDIAAANNITDINALEVGQTLVIRAGAAAEASPSTDTTTPPGSSGEQTHIVQAGENLFRIGLRYGFTAEELAAYNNIPDVSRIDVGQVIKIPPK